MNNEPIKHHYIPQFILKGFSLDRENVLYYDKNKNEIKKKKVNEIFFQRNLYRNDNIENPVEIENELAKYESEVADTFRKIINCKDNFTLNMDEEEKLKLFIAILSLRSKYAKNYFSNNMSEDNKKFYSEWLKPNENFNDLWKRNLLNICKCRSIDDIYQSSLIDKVFKAIILKDTIGYFDGYFIVCDIRGHEKLILGDCFPLVHYGTTDSLRKFNFYFFIPLSPTRLLIQAFNGVEYSQSNVGLIDKKILVRPYATSNSFKYTIRKIYENDVHKINEVIKDKSDYGYIVRDLEINNKIVKYSSEID